MAQCMCLATSSQASFLYSKWRRKKTLAYSKPSIFKNVGDSCQGTRLRVVSNFGDGDCGAGEIHTRAKVRGDATQRERPSRRVSSKFRARVCISSAPQSPSPKLETTRSLSGNLSTDVLESRTATGS